LLFLVKFEAAGFIVWEFWNCSEKVEHQVLIGWEHFNESGPRIKAITLKKDALWFILDCQMPIAGWK